MARATAMEIDAPLSAGIRRGPRKNLKKSPIKRASLGGIKKRFAGGKPSGGVRRQSGGAVPRRQSGGFTKGPRAAIPSNENREVRLNISNLAASVLSSDLRELFGEFKIKQVTVNFNEKGASAGTGDITLPKRHADVLLKKFSGVALDGKVMKFALIDTHNIANRVKFPDAPPRRSAPAASGNPGNPKKQGGKPVMAKGAQKAGAKKSKKPRREEKPKMTVEEMDAEMEAYMAARTI